MTNKMTIDYAKMLAIALNNNNARLVQKYVDSIDNTAHYMFYTTNLENWIFNPDIVNIMLSVLYGFSLISRISKKYSHDFDTVKKIIDIIDVKYYSSLFTETVEHLMFGEIQPYLHQKCLGNNVQINVTCCFRYYRTIADINTLIYVYDDNMDANKILCRYNADQINVLYNNCLGFKTAFDNLSCFTPDTNTIIDQAKVDMINNLANGRFIVQLRQSEQCYQLLLDNNVEEFLNYINTIVFREHINYDIIGQIARINDVELNEILLQTIKTSQNSRCYSRACFNLAVTSKTSDMLEQYFKHFGIPHEIRGGYDSISRIKSPDIFKIKHDKMGDKFYNVYYKNHFNNSDDLFISDIRPYVSELTINMEELRDIKSAIYLIQHHRENINWIRLFYNQHIAGNKLVLLHNPRALCKKHFTKYQAAYFAYNYIQRRKLQAIIRAAFVSRRIDILSGWKLCGDILSVIFEYCDFI